MSNLLGRLGVVTLGFGAAVAIAPGIPGQQLPTPPTEHELLETIESLRPELEEARRLAEAATARRRTERLAELAARPERPSEWVQAGPIWIVTPPGTAELAAEVFADVWREDFAALTGSPALDNAVFAFQWAWARPDPLVVDPASAAGRPIHRVELTRFWVGSRDGLRERVREAVWSTLKGDIAEGSPLARWLGASRYPSGERIARHVALSAAVPSRACLSGVLTGCEAILGLRGEAEYARLATARPPDAPAQLLLQALRLGGEGAWARLLAMQHASPLEALVWAAAVDTDILMASWRSELVDHRPTADAGLATTAGTTLLWALALALFALRSTRWRIA